MRIGLGLGLNKHRNSAGGGGGGATAPAAMTAGQWGWAVAGSGQITVNILTPPATGGSAITGYEYKRGAAAWAALGASTGSWLTSGWTDGVGTNLMVRAVNAIDVGADSDVKVATSTALTIAQQVENLRYNTTPNGRTSGAALKVVGVDPLPTEITQSGQTLTVNAPMAEIRDWDFREYTLDVRAFVRLVTQCRFGDGARTDLLYYITGTSAGAIREVSYCAFDGRADHLGAGTAINSALSGSGVSVSAFEPDYIHHCRFEGLTSDAIKTSGSTYWNGQRVEWCYFGGPQNLPNTATLWDGVTTYAAGYCVTAPGTGWNYVSKTAGNLNNALPPGASKTESNTHWQGIDPHSDAITTAASIGRTSIRRCLFDWTDDPTGALGPFAQTGVNNWGRISRNTGTDYLFDNVLVEDCISYHAPVGSFPIQVANNGFANWNGPITFRNVTIGANSGGLYFHPSTNSEVDYWINTTGTAPTGAITTDAAAAPSFSVNPGLAGTALVGVTVTATTGTATGFPTPFYDLTLEVSADGISGWTTVQADNDTYTLVSGDAGKYFRTTVNASNSTGTVQASSAVLGPIVAGYSLNEVNSNSTGRLTTTPGGTASCVTFSGWFTPASLSSPATPRFIRSSLGLDIYVSSSGVLTVQVNNSAGTGIYTAQSGSGKIVTGARQHLFVSYDGIVGAAVVRIDGVLTTMTPSVGPLTGSLRPNRSHEVLATGGAVMNTAVGDYWLEYSGAVQDYATFWNGGTPPDLAGIGAPHIWLGGDMTADERLGNAAQGWNDGYNLGSSVLSVGSATFTDV